MGTINKSNKTLHVLISVRTTIELFLNHLKALETLQLTGDLAAHTCYGSPLLNYTALKQ